MSTDEQPNTTLKAFLEKNPKLDLIKQAREDHGGVWKVLDAAVFGFLLFSPALPIIPNMKQPAIIIILWVMIALIMWCKIEYVHRAEVWYMCLYRGIILELPKTDSLKQWLCQAPMFFAYTFLMIFTIVTYVGLDPDFHLDKTKNFATTVLALIALLFVLVLTKGFVQMEQAPALLTLNQCVSFFQDPDLLAAKGFKSVHFSRLQHFIRQKHAAKDKSFSWDEVHCLSAEPDHKERISLVGGTTMWMYLWHHRDATEPTHTKTASV